MKKIPSELDILIEEQKKDSSSYKVFSSFPVIKEIFEDGEFRNQSGRIKELFFNYGGAV